MLRIIMPALLAAAAAATPTLAETPADVRARNIETWEAMFSQYPAESVAAREQGVVGFEVKLDRDGYATECRVTRSSGYRRLDDETCRLVLDRAAFKGISDAGGRRKATVTQGVVNWVLPDLPAGSDIRVADASTMPAIRIADAAPAPSSKRICKRQVRIGTLAAYDRVCMTAAEWDLQRARLQQELGELQGARGSTNGH